MTAKLVSATFTPHTGPRQPPSLLRRAATAAKAVVKHIAAGCPTVSDEEKQRRLALCQVCSEFNAGNATCRKCGCKLKLKAAWSLERCPLGRW